MPSSEAPSLAALQAQLFALITAPEGVEKGLAATGIARAELDAVIAGDAAASAVERLDVYANMYFFRIRDVLRDYFPKLAAVMGEAPFHDLVTDYLLAHPSRHPSLRYVGAALPGFVADHPLAAQRPWLAELAALEWARLDVFDRADEDLLGREALAALAPEAFVSLPLQLIAAHQIVPTGHAVEETWRALEAGEPAPPAPAPVGAPHELLVWRRGVTVYHRPLDAREAGALDLLRGGGNFGLLCTQLGHDLDADAAAQLAAGLLGRWLTDELLVAIRPTMGE